MKKITFFNARYLIILLAFGFLPFSGNSQNHFTPATNNGTGNWHFYPVYANLDGVPLEAGDEIAIFDGNICVGAKVLTSALDSSYSVTVSHDFIAYEKNDGSNGYTGGNSYTWRCYDASATNEYIGSMVYDLTYTPQDYTGSVFPATMEFRWSWVGLSFTAVAPTSGDISGHITESVTGDDIENVSVTATGTTTYVTSTDASGNYLFDNIDVDTYTLTTSHDDFQNASQANVSVTDGNTTTQNFVLTYKTGTYEGLVYDGTGAVVDGATVTINGQTDNTDATGAFSIPNLAPGVYTAVASKTNYASTTETLQRIGPDSTTTKNFTIYSAGTIAGTVTDGTNSGTEDGVLVTVVETGDTYTTGTVNPGEFTFDLSTGTYTLTFTKTGFHSATSINVVVAAGQTTNVDKTIYEENWTFTDGDPFSDVWTIYLNTVTGDGTNLKNGDELAIYAPDERGSISTFAPSGTLDNAILFPSYTGTGIAVTDNAGTASFALTGHSLQVGDVVTIHNSTGGGVYDGTGLTVSVANANDFELTGVTYVSDETVDMFKEGTITVETQAANHNLSVSDKVNITATDYDGTYTVLGIPMANRFTISGTYVNGNDDAGQWQDYTSTIVTSTAHGRSNGESVTISGTTNYNGTFTVSNITANSFEIQDNFVADDATGKWIYGEQMVGLFYLTGPVSNAGTANALKAYSVLNDGSTGYVAGEYYTFKLSYAGGSVLTAINSTLWETGSGLTFPDIIYPSGSRFSMVNLDFDMPPGSIVVDFLDENGADPDTDLSLTLYKDGTSEATATFSGGVAVTFSNLDAGTYTLNAIGERFADTTYTNIVVAPSTATNKNYVINHFDDETQTISLVAGYQLISRRVDDDTYDMSDYLVAMLPTPLTLANLDMTKDEDSDIDSYTAGVLDVPNDDIDWIIKRAYNFKMNTDDEMVITGTPISYNADITIRASAYSMISYLPDYNLDAEVAFSDLMTSDLEYIRDRHGNSLTKVGGTWVDHIGTCSAGDGFLIKWAGALTTFNYPAATKSVANYNEERELVHFPFYDGYGNPMSNVFTMYVQGSDLEVGDEIGAFDGNTLVGATVITSNNALDNNLKAFGELFDKEGFVSGNQIILKLWKSSENKEYWLNITNISEDANLYKGSVYPEIDGMRGIFDVTLSPDGINDNLAEYINIYPNPSSGFVNISSPEKIDRLMVINIMGQTVLDINPDTGNTQINLENLNQGVYFVNMIVNGQKVTKKLTIK